MDASKALSLCDVKYSPTMLSGTITRTTEQNFLNRYSYFKPIERHVTPPLCASLRRTRAKLGQPLPGCRKRTWSQSLGGSPK